VTQHTSLDAARWAEFDLDRQILMIGNEMNRVAKSVDRGQEDPVRRGYERVLRLTDLTVAGRPKKELLRELLRWRDLVAWLYCTRTLDSTAHTAAFRALLQLRPGAARQIPYLLPRARGEPRSG
jgi:hypothetical protein